MSEQAKSNIVISSWNAVEFTQNALQRLAETTERPYYLTVVDNASSDTTAEFLRDYTPSQRCLGYTAIFNTHNRGPGGAYQQGYELSRKLGVDYTVLSNNDVYYSHGWLDTLEETMNDDRSIGILGTLQPVSSVTYPYTDGVDAKSVMKMLPKDATIVEELSQFFEGRNFDDGAGDMVAINGGGVRVLESLPDAVPTSCAIVNNHLAEKVGFIADSRYEVYGSEDIDFSWELGRLGATCAMQYDVYVHHFRHRSSLAGGLDLQKSLTINNRKFVDKWYDQIKELLSDPIVRQSFGHDERSDSLTKLRRINQNIHFFENGQMVPRENLLIA